MLSLSEAMLNRHRSRLLAWRLMMRTCGTRSYELCALRLRAAIVPVANNGSTISFPLILIGVLFSWNQNINQHWNFWLFH